MLKGGVVKYWPILAILTLIFVFFYKLFFPPSLFVIPDYGRSDSWHLSIANKFYFAQQLKQNKIPVINPKIGTGYPTLAEGQTGVFFPINLLMFRLIPFVYAYNLTLVISIITAAVGTYLFCRSQKLSKLASTYAGLVFSLGGFFVFHVQHHNLIQTASLLTWLFWATSEFLKTKRVLYLLLLSLFTALQLLAGFPQLAFYSYVAIAIYIFLMLYSNKTLPRIKISILITAAIIFGFSLAAIQILPTYEFLNNSTRVSNPKSVLLEFPYKSKNLLQFIDPFILGSPKDGTYPQWTPGKWGIFWESSGYIGTGAIILALAAILANAVKKIKGQKVTVFSIIALISLLLALGPESPLHVVFSIPPFSIFRVPSRFLLVTSLSLTFLSAIYINKIQKRIVLTWLIIALSIANIFLVSRSYNPTIKSRELLKTPQTAEFFGGNMDKRIYTVGNSIIWNETFSKGWKNMDDFLFLRNFQDQNSNLIFGTNQFSAYESMQTKRQSYIGAFLRKETKFANNKIHVSKKAVSLLAANNVAYIVSPYEITNKDTLEKEFEKSENSNNVFVYKIKRQGNLFTFTNNVSIVSDSQQVVDALNQEDFDALKIPIIETAKNLNLPPQTLERSIISQNSDSTRHIMETQTNSPSFLIFSQSYYPGWQATINGEKTEIYPANVNSMAIYVPQGKNLIEFAYKPKSLYIGSIISLISFALFIIFFYMKQKHINLE